MDWSAWSLTTLSDNPIRLCTYPTTLWGAAILLRLYFELIGLCAILAPMLPKKRSVPVKNCLRMGPTFLANRGPEKFERQESGA